jgi:tape measure domain-containing protein
MATTNREIIYTLKMRNEARAAIQSFGNDFRDAVIQAKKNIQEISRLDPFRDFGQSAQRARKDVVSATDGMKQAVNSLSSSITANMSNANGAFTRLSTGAVSTAKSVQAAMAQAAQATLQAYQQINKIPKAPAPTVPRRPSSPGAQGAGNVPQVQPGAFSGVTTAIADATGRVRELRAGIEEAAAALGAFLAVREIFRLTDEFIAINSQIKLVTKSLDEQRATYSMLLGMANTNAQGLESTTNLYARISKSTGELGITQREAAIATDSVGKAMKSYQGPMQSMEMGVFQFTQGLAAGVLRGQDFRSVLEELPPLANAIAHGMGISATTLRLYAEEGKLTTKDVIDALVKEQSRLTADSEKIGVTTGQAFMILHNSLVDAVGRANEASGATSSFANQIKELATAIRSGEFGQALTQAMSGFGATLNAIVIVVRFAVEHFRLLEVAAAGLIGRFLAVPVLTAFASAMRNAAMSAQLMFMVFRNNVSTVGLATASMIGLRGAVAALGGPFGIIMTVASLAMMAIATRTDETKEATQALADTVNQLKENYIRTGDALAFLNEKEAQKAKTQIADRLAHLKNGTNTWFGPPNPNMIGAIVENVGKSPNTSSFGGLDGMGPVTGAMAYAPIAEAVEKFRAQARAGTPDAVAFGDAIEAIKNKAREAGDEGLATMAEKVLKATSTIVDHVRTVRELQDQYDYFQGTMDSARKRAFERKNRIAPDDGLPIDASEHDIFLKDMNKRRQTLQVFDPDTKAAVQSTKEVEDAAGKYRVALTRLHAEYAAGKISANEMHGWELLLAADFDKAREAAFGLTAAIRELKNERSQLTIDAMPDSRAKALAEIEERYRKRREDMERSLKAAPSDDRERQLAELDAHRQAEIGLIDRRLENGEAERIRLLEQELTLSSLIGAEKERQAYWQQAYNQALKEHYSDPTAYANRAVADYDRVKPQIAENQFRAGTLADEIRALHEEAATLGMTTKEKERYVAAQRIADAARKAGIQNSQALVQEYLKERDANEQVKESYNTFGQGFKTAMDEYLEETRNVANESKKLWTDVFGQLESSLASFITTGKFNFASFLASIANDLAKFAARQLLGNLFGGLFQQMYGGNAAGTVPSTGGAGLGLLGALFATKGPSTSTDVLGAPSAAVLPVTSTALANLNGSANLSPSSAVQSLLSARAMFSNELANPATLNKLFAMTEAEVGGQGSQAQQAFMETIFNRASARGMTLDQVLSDRKYFPQSTFDAASRVDPAAMAQKYGGIYGQVRYGSNVSGFATDNGSLDPRTGRIPGLSDAVSYKTINGETFMVPKGDQGWAQAMAGQTGVPTAYPTPAPRPEIPTGLQPGAAGLTSVRPMDPYRVDPRLVPHTGNERIDDAFSQFKQPPVPANNGLTFWDAKGAPNPMVDASKIAAPQIQANMTDAFQNVAQTTQGTFQGTFTGLAGDFTSTMGQASQTISTQFAGAFSGASSGAGGGGGGIFSWITSLFGFHRGGIVGTSGSLSRSVSAAMFMGAPRFHSGGIVGGLSHGERPIIAKDNEAVMPTVRMPDGSFGVRALGGVDSGGNSVVNQTAISVNVQGGSSGDSRQDQEHANNIARQIDRVLDRKMQQWTQNQQRPGGIVPNKELYA